MGRPCMACPRRRQREGDARRTYDPPRSVMSSTLSAHHSSGLRRHRRAALIARKATTAAMTPQSHDAREFWACTPDVGSAAVEPAQKRDGGSSGRFSLRREKPAGGPGRR